MQRILGYRSLATRSNISLAILSAVAVYGVWELWHAYTVDDPTAYLFGALFVGGSIYGLRSTYYETRDLVLTFDADPDTGKAEIVLWRPFGRRRIETALDRLTGWRLWVQTGARGQRAYLLFASDPGYEHVLQFALARGMAVPELLRKIAPEAIEDFERETGLKRDEADE